MADGRTVVAGVTLAFIVVWVVVSGALVYRRTPEPQGPTVAPSVSDQADPSRERRSR